jgi:hypothetical protein
MATSIGVPTAGGLQGALTGYGVGVLAGVGYNIVSQFTGSGLIGGAISAAVAGATVRGPVGDSIAAILGFQAGQGGLGDLGLGGMFGGNGGNNGQNNGTVLNII